MSIDGSALYIAEGLAPSGSRVSRYEAGTWTVMGDSLAGQLEALAVHRGMLMAGGSSVVAGSPVASFDGATWTSAGPLGSESARIRGFAVLGDELLAGRVPTLGQRVASMFNLADRLHATLLRHGVDEMLVGSGLVAGMLEFVSLLGVEPPERLEERGRRLVTDAFGASGT